MGDQAQVVSGDGHKLSAYRATAPGNTRWIVVVQEAFGVNPHIRVVCDTFARAGFNAIAPSLFDRVERNVEMDYTPASVARYMKFREQMNKADVLADLVAAADSTGSAKVGIVGYCFGGTAAWWAATGVDRFAAASCWYGGGIFAEKDLQPRCPVQMHFGGIDPHIAPSQVEAIRAAQPGVDIHVYDGADHGFGCDARASFHEPSFHLAFDRTTAFLGAHQRAV